MTNKLHSVTYVGVTSNLERRVYEHKNKLIDGFTKKYNINKLVFTEVFHYVRDAIASEKRIKGWTRKKRENLLSLSIHRGVI